MQSSHNRHPGVQYRALDGLPGEYFDCAMLRASMSTDSCARRWKAAQSEVGATCQKCPIGATHAGQSVRVSVFCLRCGNTGARLLRRSICISCFNREREWLVGRNRRGAKPVRALPPWELRIRAGERTRTVLACTVAEAVMAAFRMFGDVQAVYPGAAPAHPFPQQLELV